MADDASLPQDRFMDGLLADIQKLQVESQEHPAGPGSGFMCFFDREFEFKVTLSGEQYSLFDRMAERIARHRSIGTKRGRPAIKEGLQSIVAAWLSRRLASRPELRKRLDSLLERLASDTAATVYFPVAGLSLQEGVDLQFGEVTFRPTGKELLNPMVSGNDYRYSLSDKADRFNNFVQECFTKSFSGMGCVATASFSTDRDLAIQKGLREVEDKLDLIAAIIPAIQGVQERAWFTIGPAYNRVFVYALADDGLTEQEHSDRSLGWCSIGKPQVKRLEDFGYRQLTKLVASTSLTETETRVYRMAKWLGMSMRMIGQEERFLLATNALEAVFTKRDVNAPVAQNLSEGVAIVIACDTDRRLEIVKKVRRLYGLRSQLVHGGLLDVRSDDLHQLLRLAFETLATLLVNLPALRSQDLDAWLLQKKLNAPSGLSMLPLTDGVLWG